MEGMSFASKRLEGSLVPSHLVKSFPQFSSDTNVRPPHRCSPRGGVTPSTVHRKAPIRLCPQHSVTVGQDGVLRASCSLDNVRIRTTRLGGDRTTRALIGRDLLMTHDTVPLEQVDLSDL